MATYPTLLTTFQIILTDLSNHFVVDFEGLANYRQFSIKASSVRQKLNPTTCVKIVLSNAETHIAKVPEFLRLSLQKDLLLASCFQ